MQGLATCQIPLKITVVDPSKESLKRAIARWDEVVCENSLHSIHFSITLEKLHRQVDLCLVTTTADMRVSVVEQILSTNRVQYWVLEKVLAQSEDQINRLEQLLLSTEGAWVNTPRRAYSWHQQIHKQLPTSQVWQVVGAGGGWGMACNSIHFIDLIAWWTEEELVSVDTTGLENWFPSKRNSFGRYMGSLKYFILRDLNWNCQQMKATPHFL